MPPVGEQMALPGSRTNPELTAARFLLKPGRKYDDAVKAFQPYDRDAGSERGGTRSRPQLDNCGRENAMQTPKTFIFVNNRLVGNALETISEMVERSLLTMHE